MSKSPFYKTGISKSPLFDMGHGKDNESHMHATMTSKPAPSSFNKRKPKLEGKAKEEAINETSSLANKAYSSLTSNLKKISEKPLQMNEGDISKKRRARRAAQMKKMEKKLNSMSIDENTIKPGMEEAYDKLSAKIDAHALKTTNLIRGTKYKS